MSTPVQGGAPAGGFRVLGFPVHVDLTFVLFVGLLGCAAGDHARARSVIWLAARVPGRAAARTRSRRRRPPDRGEPAIALVALGGVTTYAPPRQLSRLSSLGISLAGPAVGLVLGGALLLVGRPVDVEPGGLAGVHAAHGDLHDASAGASSTCCRSCRSTAARPCASCCPVTRSRGRGEPRSSRSSSRSASRWSPSRPGLVGHVRLVLVAFLVLANVMAAARPVGGAAPHEVASGAGAGEG